MAYSRREFVESSVAAVLVGIPTESLRSLSLSVTGPGPDLAVINGRLYTVDDTLPLAEALAIKNGRFIAVGSNADISDMRKRKKDSPWSA